MRVKGSICVKKRTPLSVGRAELNLSRLTLGPGSLRLGSVRNLFLMVVRFLRPNPSESVSRPGFGLMEPLAEAREGVAQALKDLMRPYILRGQNRYARQQQNHAGQDGKQQAQNAQQDQAPAD